MQDLASKKAIGLIANNKIKSKAATCLIFNSNTIRC